MDSDATDTVIHRKARVAREGHDARAMSPAKALRLALAKAADAELDLVLSVSTVEQHDVDQQKAQAAFEGEGLLVLIEGAAGGCGAVRVDPACLAAVIEHQTTGRVSDRSVEGRAVTRTDAAMVAPLLDALFRGVEEAMAGQPDGATWAGYSFGAMIEDVHGLGLALRAPEFQFFRLTVELGGGARSGVMDFLLPLATPVTAAEPAGTDRAAAGAHSLEQIAMEAPVTLQATLGHLALPLDQAMSLAVGDVLPIDGPGGLDLRLEGARGHLVAQARLGQVNGQRALRLLSGPDHGTTPGGSGNRDGMAGGGHSGAAHSAGQGAPSPMPAIEGEVVETQTGPHPMSMQSSTLEPEAPNTVPDVGPPFSVGPEVAEMLATGSGAVTMGAPVSEPLPEQRSTPVEQGGAGLALTQNSP